MSLVKEYIEDINSLIQKIKELGYDIDDNENLGDWKLKKIVYSELNDRVVFIVDELKNETLVQKLSKAIENNPNFNFNDLLNVISVEIKGYEQTILKQRNQIDQNIELDRIKNKEIAKLRSKIAQMEGDI